ncbi:MAG: rhomboid family intramembrane serine protease [Nitrospinales bacterium]
MLPLRDENPTSHFPFITILLIVGNIGVFINSILDIQVFNANITEYGLVPTQLMHYPWPASATLITSMFIHAGWGHLLGNMLYLWIFGNNIEDTLGMGRFIFFYLTCGVLAALCYVATDPASKVPMVGASGAISGILGAYLILYPKARVLTLIFLGFYITMIRIPAMVLLGLWLILQIGSGYFLSAEEAGVAWFAHISGFLAGMILIYPFKFIPGARKR